jgi:hypothetical protein
MGWFLHGFRMIGSIVILMFGRVEGGVKLDLTLFVSICHMSHLREPMT